jgi:mono/diheme cytochrome c family protein
MFESTPERMARGEYLVEHVVGCFGCHSEPDKNNTMLPIPEQKGAGRNFGDEGAPWINAPNISSDKETGIGAWSDDELARAIREGIGRDGRALFPMMPYQAYRQMSDEDLASIIVYVRSAKPVRRKAPPMEIPFPLNRIINTMPQPLEQPVSAPDMSDMAKRGDYLFTIMDCGGCHSPRGERGPIAGMDFAGGNSFKGSDGRTVASANITQDPSGIPYYTEDVFLQVMREGRVVERQLSDAMPWGYFRGMTDEDLKALFLAVKKIAPVKHRVDNSLRPTQCKLCTLVHGGGDQN